MEILYEWLNKHGHPEPEWAPDDKKVTIGDTPYKLSDFGELTLIRVS